MREPHRGVDGRLDGGATTGAVAHETLRAWARGSYSSEAGAELLLRSGLADRGFTAAWSTGSLDEDAYRSILDRPQGSGERRLARLAGALLDVDSQVGIVDVLKGSDRRHLSLALAALGHAGGSHQQSDLTFTEDGLRVLGRGYAAQLVAWLDEDSIA